MGGRNQIRHPRDNRVVGGADASAVGVHHLAYKQRHYLALEAEVAKQVVIHLLELTWPGRIAGVGLALVDEDALNDADLLGLASHLHEAVVRLVVVGGEHPFHPVRCAFGDIAVDTVWQEGLDVAAADGDVDHADLDVLGQVCNQRAAEVVRRGEAGALAAKRRNGGVPFALYAAQLIIVGGCEHHEALVHALEVARLDLGVALHIGLAEAEVDVEVRVWPGAAGGVAGLLPLGVEESDHP